MFLIFFPKEFIKTVVVVETSKECEKEITLGKFLRFIGIWLAITRSSPGNLNRESFWSLKPISRKSGAPFRLNDIMSKNRFKEIFTNLTFTNQDAPAYVDRLWEVR